MPLRGAEALNRICAPIPLSRLREVTSEKQTCTICMRTIRQDATSYHKTECPHPHYFHSTCWARFRATRRGRDPIACPYCRHVQASLTPEPSQGCALCLRSEPNDALTTRCGHAFCGYCITHRARTAAESGTTAACPTCQRTLLDEHILISYLFTRRISAAPLPPLAEQILARYRSGYVSRQDLLDFCLDDTTHVLLAPEDAPGENEEDHLQSALIGLTQAELSHRLHHCTLMEEWNELQGEDYPCPICLEPVADSDDIFETACVPCDHRYHKACWEGQPPHMQRACRICGQQELSDSVLDEASELFEGETGPGRQFPPAAVQMLTRYITGAVSAAEFQRWCQADSTRRAFGQAPVDAS